MKLGEFTVAVIGGAVPTDTERSMAGELGSLLAEAGFAVICGGGTGVMEAVCSGRKRNRIYL